MTVVFRKHPDTCTFYRCLLSEETIIYSGIQMNTRDAAGACDLRYQRRIIDGKDECNRFILSTHSATEEEFDRALLYYIEFHDEIMCALMDGRKISIE